MSVSAIMSGGASGTNDAAEIKQLQQQLETLQKQLAKEATSKDGAQVKQLAEQQIQAQIDGINAQIAQLQAQSSQSKPKAAKPEEPAKQKQATEFAGVTIDTQI
jgi:uncharacterized membrane protein (DUF106 family)